MESKDSSSSCSDSSEDSNDALLQAIENAVLDDPNRFADSCSKIVICCWIACFNILSITMAISHHSS